MRSFLLLLIICVASWAFVRPEFFYLHDFLHVARVTELARGLQEGQFPVVWSGNFGFGYGMPLFLFYAPLPYYFGALLLFGGVPAVQIVQLLFILSTVTCALAAYQWGKEEWGESAALLVAALITLAPYRAVNLYVRGALSESWGMSAAVGALWGVKLLTSGKKHGLLITWLALTALFLSHNLSALIFIPLIFLYGVLQLRNIRGFFMLLLPFTAALFSSSFYTLPAVLEKDTTHIASILTGYFDFHIHFVYIRQLVTPFWGYGGSSWGVTDGISYYLGSPLLLGLAALGVTSVMVLLRQKKLPSRTVLGYCALGLSALFMSVGRSQFIWDAVPTLALVQFPWRFLAPATVFLSFAAVSWFQFVPKKWHKSIAVAGVLCICAAEAHYFQPEKFGGVVEKYYFSDAKRIQVEASPVLPDFIPLTLQLPVATDLPVVSCNPAASCEHVHVQKISSVVWHVESAVSEPTTLTFAIANFPGWTVEGSTGNTVSNTTNEAGFLTFTAQKGETGYTVSFEPTALRRITGYISLVSSVGMVWYIHTQQKKKKKYV